MTSNLTSTVTHTYKHTLPHQITVIYAMFPSPRPPWAEAGGSNHNQAKKKKKKTKGKQKENVLGTSTCLMIDGPSNQNHNTSSSSSNTNTLRTALQIVQNTCAYQNGTRRSTLLRNLLELFLQTNVAQEDLEHVLHSFLSDSENDGSRATIRVPANDRERYGSNGHNSITSGYEEVDDVRYARSDASEEETATITHTNHNTIAITTTNDPSMTRSNENRNRNGNGHPASSSILSFPIDDNDRYRFRNSGSTRMLEEEDVYPHNDNDDVFHKHTAGQRMDDPIQHHDELEDDEEIVDYHKYPENDDEEDNEEEYHDIDYSNDSSNIVSNSSRVLGPLGGTYTTGVVLEGNKCEVENKDNVVRVLSEEGCPSLSLSNIQIKHQVDNSIAHMNTIGEDMKEDDAAVSLLQRSIEVAAAALNPWSYLTDDNTSNTNRNAHATDMNEDEIDLIYRVCSHLIPLASSKDNSCNVAYFNGREIPMRPVWDGNKDEGYTAILVSASELDHMDRFLEATRSDIITFTQENIKDEVASTTLVCTNNQVLSHKPQSYDSDDVNETVIDYGEEDNDSSTKSTNTRRSTADEIIYTTSELTSRLDQDHDMKYESFNLPILFSPHRTGFEESSSLILVPGMLVANRYLVQEELGSAAFSITYRCMDLTQNETEEQNEVCLKVIRNKKDYFDQSLDEIKILNLLKETNKCEEHNIYVMLDYFYYREHLIIVTELLRQNLYDFGRYIEDNDEPVFFTLKRVCFIARQVLIALEFIHNLGIVHTDLKPENILISSYSSATIKLIDFGSSCFETDRPSSYIQSRSYRAPEVILGLPYNQKIDIWSLGCVIAELYTGYVTFQNKSISSMLSRIEAICGTFPVHMVKQGKYSKRFFSEGGLIFQEAERANDDSDLQEEDIKISKSLSFDEDDDDEDHFYILQPKITTLSERLGFKASIELSNEEIIFVDFIRTLLTIDPNERPTATEALQHPWILQSFELDESDIEYP